jgi:3-methyladenine DNA glycosylase AlkC
METEKFSLKDHLFHEAKVAKLASEITHVYAGFKGKAFVKEVIQAFPQLELKERIYHITICLNKYLPFAYNEAVGILVRALPQPCNPDLTDNDFGDFIYAPYAHFIAVYGCKEMYLQTSLAAIEQITMRFSAEDAIRYFINAFPEPTLAQMQLWATHKHYHVRRLASEGLRPKLPWCQKIHLPIASALPVLNLLHADNTRFVTRSVANHLNDISKTHPSMVIATLQDWKSQAVQTDAELSFIIKHALRTLIKEGNPEALQLVGIGSDPAIKMLAFELTQELKFNDYLSFKFELLALDDCRLMLDYVLYFKSKNGQLSRKKVFKIKQLSLKKGETTLVQKAQQLKEKMSTRILYPGVQVFELQINGAAVWKGSFSIG